MAQFDIKRHEEVVDAINDGIEIRIGQIRKNANGWLVLNVYCGEEYGTVEVWVTGDYFEERDLIKNGYENLEVNWDENYLTVDINED